MSREYQPGTIRCDECGYEMEVGDVCYKFNDKFLCENCMDKELEELKRESEIDLDDYWFNAYMDMREEY